MLIKTRICVLLFAIVFFGAISGLWAQKVIHTIDLDDKKGALDNPFGMKLSPDGSSLYATICGIFSDNNNRIVEIDTTTFQIVNEGTTGKFPEEIEFLLNGNGQIELVFVSNSSDNSISVLKPDLSFEKEIVLDPSSNFYPFGLVMGPGNRYLYVSTLVSDDLIVIDTAPGASHLTVVNKIKIGGSVGRLAKHNHKLLAPCSVHNDGAYLKIMDFSNPANVESVLLDNNLDAYGYPVSLNDVEVSDDGYAYVPTLDYFGNTNFYEVDLLSSPPSISKVIDTSSNGGPAYSLAHGVGASPDKNTLIITYFDNAHIKALSRKAGSVLLHLDVDLVYGMINEALFSIEGDNLFLTNQNESKIYVVSQIPKHGMYLTGETSAPINSQVSLKLYGGQVNRRGLLLFSLNLGPIVTKPVTLDIGWPFYILVDNIFNGASQMLIPTFNIPNDNTLQGLKLYFQALTEDADLKVRPSNLHTLEIL